MKLIVDIKDNITPTTALRCLQAVIEEGKVSQGEHGKKYYCWATTFKTEEGSVIVFTRQYRKNDCFLIQKFR